MPETSEVQHLRDKAIRCRLLALGFDARTADGLNQLADELEARADGLDGHSLGSPVAAVKP